VSTAQPEIQPSQSVSKAQLEIQISRRGQVSGSRTRRPKIRSIDSRRDGVTGSQPRITRSMAAGGQGSGQCPGEESPLKKCAIGWLGCSELDQGAEAAAKGEQAPEKKMRRLPRSTTSLQR
jgi:hypothetical protein